MSRTERVELATVVLALAALALLVWTAGPARQVAPVLVPDHAPLVCRTVMPEDLDR